MPEFHFGDVVQPSSIARDVRVMIVGNDGGGDLNVVVLVPGTEFTWLYPVGTVTGLDPRYAILVEE